MRKAIHQFELTVSGRNAILNIFELWIGLAAVISLCVFLADPNGIEHSSVSDVIGHTWTEVWQVGYGISGMLIWFGLLRPSPRWEIAGLSILGSTTSINGVAIVHYFGLRGAAPALTLLALAVASWSRGLFVYIAARRLGLAFHRHHPE